MHEIRAKGLLSAHNGMNIYRGCQHGCIYCDARSRCYQMDHLFEDIEVKINAPELLEQALRTKRQRCMISTGAMSDPYIPLEEQLCLTRRCVELIDRYGFGLAIQTKSSRIERDIDLLTSINARAKCVVQMTLTTYDEALCRIVEPNVSTTRERFETLMRMRERGIPTVVWLSPFLPWVNDTRENIEGVLDYCVRAGVKGVLQFGVGLTLREGDREYYYAQLDRHFPGLKERYIKRYGNDYVLPSPRSRELLGLICSTCERKGIMYNSNQVFDYMSRPDSDPAGQQLSIFD